MKKYWKSLTLGTLAAAAMMPLLASCDDDDTVDPYDINYVYLYQPDKTFATLSYKADGSSINADFQDPLTLVPVRLTKAAPADLSVTVAVDPSLVDEYNQANGTSYAFLPGARLLKDTFAIPQGQYVSADSLVVSFEDRTGFQPGTRDYILPIVIASSGNSGVQISKSSRIFLTIDADYVANIVNINDIAIPVNSADPDWQAALRSIALEDLVTCTYQPLGTVDVAFQIDESKVQAYRDANPDAAVQFMAGAKLSTTHVTIGTDATSCGAAVTLDAGECPEAANGTVYVLPLTVTSVTGGSAEAGTKTAYVTVTQPATLDQVTEPVGDFYEFTSALTGDINGSPTGYFGTSIWDIVHSEDYDYMYANTYMTLDLGETVNMTMVVPGFFDGSYAPSRLQILTSRDGQKWTDWGWKTIKKDRWIYLKFSAPQRARYIRMGVSNGCYPLGFEVYTK